MTLLLAAAGAKLVAALAAWLFVSCAVTPRFWLPPWYYLGLALTFGAAGYALTSGGRRDTPARHLGGTFVFFGTLFADRVLLGRLDCLTGTIATAVRLMLALQPIAFNAVILWRFAWTFPNVQPGIIRPSLARGIDRVCLAAGIVLFAGNLAMPAAAGLPPVAAVLRWLNTDTPQGQFWLTLSLLTLPSLVILVLKLRAAHAETRRRLAIVVGGLVVATFPMVLDVVLTGAFPAYQAFVVESGRGPLRALVLTLFALVSPASAAYAVVVEQVFDVRFVIRTAVRYSLVRYFGFMVLAGPLIALAVYLYANRRRPLTDLSAGGSVMLWFLVFTSAAVLLLARRPLLDAIDRHFFREEYDARRILSSLIEITRNSTAADLTERIAAEVDRALHLERAVLLVRDDEQDGFRDRQHRIRDLAAATPLARLIGGADTPLDVDLSPARSPMGRLSEPERQWLADAGARLLVPFPGSGGELLGILVLGDKRSDTPFTSEDRMLLMAVAASAALALESHLRAEQPVAGGRRDLFTSEPAAQCERCGSIQSSRGLAMCSACRGHLRPCVLPSVLSGKFKIDRQIGVGGMGVVYQAHDLDLARPVALKTLPKVAARDVARLRREARAMATIQHPHLAVIYGTEIWRGVPVLVLEYLSAGTLADRIRLGPLTPDDVAAVGVAMADVLDHVHRAGLLHRDVKPSNIGYTSDGTPKLMDFGLARLTSVTAGPGSTTGAVVSAAPPTEHTDLWQGLAAPDTQPLVGTAAYLSPEAVALQPPTHAWDLWALAVTLHEALTGCNPFVGASVTETLQRIAAGEVPDVRSRRSECPAPFAELLASALSLDPRRRPTTAAEFLSRLQHVRGVHPAHRTAPVVA